MISKEDIRDLIDVLREIVNDERAELAQHRDRLNEASAEIERLRSLPNTHPDTRFR